jgi:hypothetical protein
MNMVDPASAARVQMLAACVNPVRTRADWEGMRAEVLADPGAFHGRIAAQNLHWLVDVAGRPAWLSRGADGEWTGWDAETAAPVAAAPAVRFLVPNKVAVLALSFWRYMKLPNWAMNSLENSPYSCNALGSNATPHSFMSALAI